MKANKSKQPDPSATPGVPRNARAAQFSLGNERYAVFSFDLAADQHHAFLAVLTLSERAVATLCLQGMSSREIARKRAVSERTVANQLATIYRKLGVQSRRELRAFFRQFAATGASA
jgi:DNA-binding CsgD family transcriptional regulator